MVGEAGCAVYPLHRAGAAGLYLKHGEGAFARDVLDEAVRFRWLAGRIAVPALRHLLLDGESSWLLTDALSGPTAWQRLRCASDARARVAITELLADFLRRFHALPVDLCPFEAGHRLRLAHARERLEAGLIDEEDFGTDHGGWSAARLWDGMTALLPLTPDRVVTHGDYSLDNVVMRDGLAPACLDVGRAGIADRYQDLAIMAECLREFGDALPGRFLARYGEAQPDERRMRFHVMLDECF